MKLIKQTTVLLLGPLLLHGGAGPSWPMQTQVSRNQLILSGPLSGFEMEQFTSALTASITTVVFYNSTGGDYAAGVNLAAENRRRGLSTVAPGFCNSSCANAFIGGKERFLANAQTRVAFPGSYANTSRPRQGIIGVMRTYYAEMTGGKVDNALVQVWLQKPRAGFVYFFKSSAYSCDGTEPKRPIGCEKLPQRAIDQGIITSLDDVEVNPR